MATTKIRFLFNALLILLAMVFVSTARPIAGEGPTGHRIGPPQLKPPPATTYQDLKLAPGDTVSITVDGQPDLSGTFALDDEGRVALPLLGLVPLVGLTPSEAETKLRTLLEQDLLQRAIVHLDPKPHQRHTVTVAGDVIHPGAYAVHGPVKLLDILAQAGPGAGRQARIIRGDIEPPTPPGSLSDSPSPPLEAQRRQRAQGRQTIYVDLERLFSGDVDSNLWLLPGDLVYLPTHTVEAQVIGEVFNPGAFPHQQGMTVLKLIALAGGETPKANMKKIVALRVRGGEVLEVPLGLGDPVLPDDTIRVPKSFW